MTKKYRFKEGLEFEARTFVISNDGSVPLWIGGNAANVSREFLEEVVPELSESERLPNGTVVREAGGHVDPHIATKCDDGQWEVAGQQGCFMALAWIDSGDYEILTTGVKPAAEPRVFNAGDPEPGPEVTHVKDFDGDLWTRQDSRWTSDAVLGRTRAWDDSTERVYPIIFYAPLTDVSADYA